MEDKFEHWINHCLKCSSLTSKIICRPCFDMVKLEPELSGFLNSEEQMFIEVKQGFIAFLCNKTWCLPKIKIKIEHSDRQPTESITDFFREYLELDLKNYYKYRLYTEEEKCIIRNTYYVDCRKLNIFPIIQKAFLKNKEKDIFKHYDVKKIVILKKQGDYLIPYSHNGKKMNIYNDVGVDESIYNCFDISREIKPRIVARYNKDRYEILYKMLKPRMKLIIKNMRFKTLNVEQILHYTNLMWKHKNFDPCQKYHQIMTTDLFKRSDIFNFLY